MNKEEHDNFYGFTDSQTPQQHRQRVREIMYVAEALGATDEDTLDSEAMENEYPGGAK